MSFKVTYEPAVIKIRRDTETNWSGMDPILAEGEMGIVMDSGVPIAIKIGDGTTAWTSLPMFVRNIAQNVLTGTTAPSSTPAFVGQMFVDTTNGNVYVAKGTSSSADWKRCDNA